MTTKRKPPVGAGGSKNSSTRRTDSNRVHSYSVGNSESSFRLHSDDLAGGQAEADAPRQGCAAGPPPLPCLNSNNSTENFRKSFSGKVETASEGGTFRSLKTTSDGRKIITHLDGSQLVVDGFSTSLRKQAFALVANVQHMAERFGLERLGFLTLTFRENLTDFREAQRRFNSLRTHVLVNLFEDWIVTVEPQKRGAVHYHLLVVCSGDIRSGVDFDAIEKGDYSSASPLLRGLWAQLRSALPLYGFGRSELLPVRSTGDGIARYVGKYLEKGASYRGDQFKGARMVRYSRGWRCATPRFSWTSPAAMRWRALIGGMIEILGGDDLDCLRSQFGKAWAFKLLQLLQHGDIDGTDPCLALARLDALRSSWYR